jgi:hypothetical protein
LNKLYVELLKHNPDWGEEARIHDMNHFMARLIFCFFAEDTDIFQGENLFTGTVDLMSQSDSSNTHVVIGEIFGAMDTNFEDRPGAKIANWADKFPYVNGELFSGSTDVPKFTRIARSYLLHIGNLDWQKINPDIFGSMIQAVTDEDERDAMGMHYTSVPNILKVLNPLFLDDLRQKLEDAGANTRKLLNLRARISKIRVFDPACGSGNFLVIAYKEMRAIEAEINERRGEKDIRTQIPLTNFRGIEIRDFSAEIARLALIIAEFQCDVLYRGQREALREFLPLNAENWITCGNALRLNWLNTCPPSGSGAQVGLGSITENSDDRSEVDFENEGGETYICGNPPYTGSKKSEEREKADLAHVLESKLRKYKTLDLVTAWFWKSLEYLKSTEGRAALVATKSVCQGEQAAQFWMPFFDEGGHIRFAHRPFEWANLATNNAGVTCVIIGIDTQQRSSATIYEGEIAKVVKQIGPYLIEMPKLAVEKSSTPLNGLPAIQFGDHPYYGLALSMDAPEAREKMRNADPVSEFLLPMYGTTELTKASPRFVIWVSDEKEKRARQVDEIRDISNAVSRLRSSKTKDKAAIKLAETPYRFRDQYTGVGGLTVFGRHSSENRDYLPFSFFKDPVVVTDAAFFARDFPPFASAIFGSRMFTTWISTVCGRIRNDFRLSNTLGWNTFPVPVLTEKNKSDLTRSVQDIMIAREAHWPATISDLYDPEQMPLDLREAHERNDEVLERAYIGRRFKNDTERLEKLFELYTKMVSRLEA